MLFFHKGRVVMVHGRATAFPRFLAFSVQHPLCQRVAEACSKLSCVTDPGHKLIPIGFSDGPRFKKVLETANGRLEEVVLIYPLGGVSAVRYTKHELPMELKQIEWVWMVSINPHLNLEEKKGDEVIKSIAHIFGRKNVLKTQQQNKLPWGADVEKQLVVSGSVEDTEKHFRSSFV